MSQYPKWKYHATEQALIVDDLDAEEALGEGWFDTPAEASESALDDSNDSGDDSDDSDDSGDDDDAAKADAEAKRKALLAEAKALGIDIYHTSGIEKIQAAIDAY